MKTLVVLSQDRIVGAVNRSRIAALMQLRTSSSSALSILFGFAILNTRSVR